MMKMMMEMEGSKEGNMWIEVACFILKKGFCFSKQIRLLGCFNPVRLWYYFYSFYPELYAHFLLHNISMAKSYLVKILQSHCCCSAYINVSSYYSLSLLLFFFKCYTHIFNTLNLFIFLLLILVLEHQQQHQPAIATTVENFKTFEYLCFVKLIYATAISDSHFL